jgi:hypothetical protein
MSKHEVEVEIDELTGEVKLGVHGVKGSGCLKILDALVKELGSSNDAPQPTREMHESEAKAGVKR